MMAVGLPRKVLSFQDFPFALVVKFMAQILISDGSLGFVSRFLRSHFEAHNRIRFQISRTGSTSPRGDSFDAILPILCHSR
jgi:hypothetical protein